MLVYLPQWEVKKCKGKLLQSIASSGLVDAAKLVAVLFIVVRIRLSNTSKC